MNTITTIRAIRQTTIELARTREIESILSRDGVCADSDHIEKGVMDRYARMEETVRAENAAANREWFAVRALAMVPIAFTAALMVGLTVAKLYFA